MKKTLSVLLPVTGLFLILTAFYSGNPSGTAAAVPGDTFTIPEDVSVILNDKCFGCHNVDSQSDKAKKKLLIDELEGLSKAKLVGKLGEMGQVVEKSEMPPAKFLEKYPDKALTEDEATRLKTWTDNAAEELMK